ncbi:MAG: AMP-binding protein, partial [Planctomycetes bacterium]|nr:AMP-binding protein [Planctomycetota bacterium]
LVSADSESPQGSVIGRPLADLRLAILDAHGEPVPIGVAGEIHVGGAGLARGYLGRPDLTAERFVPDPFSCTAGARLYRTGDLARRRADGDVEYLGRVDDQVKIRGFRIELGEVEAVLAEHPSVREAVVIARGEAGDRRLVAYVVCRTEVSTSELRPHVASQLPEYMVPSAFVKLDALPLTRNGKIDRRALPAPDGIRPSDVRPFVSPRDDVEAAVARAFDEALGVSPIGATDDFFELGGHSMLAVRAIAAIRTRLGIDVPLAAIFEAPTVERLAARLREREPRRDSSPLVRLKAGGSHAPLFLAHAAGGTVIAYRHLAAELHDRPVFGLQAAGLEGECEPLSRLDEMAARYVAAMRDVRREGPIHVAGWSLGGIVAVEIARHLVDAGVEVGVVALFDTTAPAKSRWSDPRAVETLAIPPDLPDDVSAEDRERLTQVYRAHLRAAYGSWVGPCRGPIVLFRASEPSGGAPTESETDPTLGWAALTTERVDVRFVPGTHESLLEPPNVSVLANELTRCLDEAPHWR